MRVHHEDARPYLRRTDARYDAIMVDVYRQPYIPFYLATREFFELARDRLRPGGVVIVNVGHPEGQDELEQVLGATMARRVRHGPARPERGHEHACSLGDRLRRPPRRGWQRAAPRCRPTCADWRCAAAARLAPRLAGGTVYTDDKAPVEWLVDKSIVEYAADGD